MCSGWNKVQNPVSSSEIVYSITLLHADLQYACNISEKYWKDTLKAVRGVYFIVYALSSMSSGKNG